MNGYWKDKKSYPLHHVYKLIDTYWKKERKEKDLADTLILLRDAVFGALDIHSLSLVLDTPTHEIVTIMTKSSSWSDSRRNVRTYCSENITSLISKGKVDYLESAALTRDGFGYLIPSLKEKILEIYTNARPEVKAGKVDIRPLARSSIGKQLLRDLQITKGELAKKDPLVKELQDNYDALLLDLEIDGAEDTKILQITEQMTLNGQPTGDAEGQEEVIKSKEQEDGVQTPLTEYLSKSKKKPKSTKKKRMGRKGRQDEKKKKEKASGRKKK
ncbi:MAG: hypothetical protein ACTSUB_03020 [Candidatus Thorarchaeota archaeon]